jgi:hypothetical protein
MAQLKAMVEEREPMAEEIVAAGYFAAAKPVPPDADEQARILAAMGRSS